LPRDSADLRRLRR